MPPKRRATGRPAAELLQHPPAPQPEPEPEPQPAPPLEGQTGGLDDAPLSPPAPDPYWSEMEAMEAMVVAERERSALARRSAAAPQATQTTPKKAPKPARRTPRADAPLPKPQPGPPLPAAGSQQVAQLPLPLPTPQKILPTPEPVTPQLYGCESCGFRGTRAEVIEHERTCSIHLARLSMSPSHEPEPEPLPPVEQAVAVEADEEDAELVAMAAVADLSAARAKLLAALREADWTLAETLCRRIPLLAQAVEEAGSLAPRNPSLALLSAEWADFSLHAALIAGAPPALLPQILEALQLPRELLVAAIALLSGDGAAATSAYGALSGADYTTAVVSAGLDRARALSAATVLVTQARREYDVAALVAASAQACEAVPESSVLKGALAEAVQSQLQLRLNLPPAAAPERLRQAQNSRHPGTAALLAKDSADQTADAPSVRSTPTSTTASAAAKTPDTNAKTALLLNAADAWLEHSTELTAAEQPPPPPVAGQTDDEPEEQGEAGAGARDVSAGGGGGEEPAGLSISVGEAVEIWSKSAACWCATLCSFPCVASASSTEVC
jgi:hypothetical protein